jgi:hypothetical protein
VASLEEEIKPPAHLVKWVAELGVDSGAGRSWGGELRARWEHDAERATAEVWRQAFIAGVAYAERVRAEALPFRPHVITLTEESPKS